MTKYPTLFLGETETHIACCTGLNLSKTQSVAVVFQGTPMRTPLLASLPSNCTRILGTFHRLPPGSQVSLGICTFGQKKKKNLTQGTGMSCKKESRGLRWCFRVAFKQAHLPNSDKHAGIPTPRCRPRLGNPRSRPGRAPTGRGAPFRARRAPPGTGTGSSST